MEEERSEDNEIFASSKRILRLRIKQKGSNWKLDLLIEMIKETETENDKGLKKSNGWEMACRRCCRKKLTS